MVNPFIENIELFFKEHLYIETLSHRLSSKLKVYQKMIEAGYKNTSNELGVRIRNNDTPIFATSLIISDITESIQKNEIYNYPTGTTNKIYLQDFPNHIKETETRYLYYNLCSCIENLNTFIISITKKYIEIKFAADKNERINQLQKAIRGSTKGDKLFDYIKSLSENFGKFENTNSWNVQIYNWYQMLYTIRNGIIHDYPIVISKDKINGISKPNRDILEHFFICKNREGEFVINTEDTAHIAKIEKSIAEVGFLIFKCYSLDLNYDWHILYHYPQTKDTNS
jgi:hypothetical protein